MLEQILAWSVNANSTYTWAKGGKQGLQVGCAVLHQQQVAQQMA
jgi:hypothetical protein